LQQPFLPATMVGYLVTLISASYRLFNKTMQLRIILAPFSFRREPPAPTSPSEIPLSRPLASTVPHGLTNLPPYDGVSGVNLLFHSLLITRHGNAVCCFPSFPLRGNGIKPPIRNPPFFSFTFFPNKEFDRLLPGVQDALILSCLPFLVRDFRQ